ncbi:MAG: TIR domain-containing protein, partial [Chloroflexota bacterium]
MDTTSLSYDVFLSCNDDDIPVVEALASRLEDEAKLKPFFAPWHLVPGKLIQESLEEALGAASTCAVFIGSSGIGSWANEQMRVAIQRRVDQRDFRVIPVLLPGASRGQRGHLPAFLTQTVWVEFQEDLKEEDAFLDLIAGVRGTPRGRRGVALYEGERPYLGLEVFQEQHARFFFGRRADTDWLVDYLKSSRFLAVIGPSGSGKSSLVRAGLVHALRQDELPTSSQWPLAIIKPGERPIESLAMSLGNLTNRVGSIRNLIDDLQKNTQELHLAVRYALVDKPSDYRAVLIVDQFEEVFTQCHDEQEQKSFIDNLLYASAVDGGQTVVVLTMRADFYGECTIHPDLAVRITQDQMLIASMTEQGLREAIVQPAHLVGLTFETGLVDTLLNDIQAEPGKLPLLAHTLLELYRQRDGHQMTFEAYRSIGGVRGAIAHRAEAIYNGLTEAQQQDARRIMLRLIQLNETAKATRRRAMMDELSPSDEHTEDVDKTLQLLIEGRLLVTDTLQDKDNQEQDVVDIAHEALAQEWSRFQTWIDDEAGALRLHNRLSETTKEWTEDKESSTYLYRGKRLERVLQELPADALSPQEQAFVEASVTEQKKAQRKKRVRILIQTLAAGIGVLLVALIIMLYQRYNSTRLWGPHTGSPEDGVLSLAMSIPNNIANDEAMFGNATAAYYAGTANIGVATGIRQDNTLSWTLSGRDDGLPVVTRNDGGEQITEEKGINDLTVDLLDSERVLAFVNHQGIYERVDNGAEWASFEPTLPVTGTFYDAALRGNLALVVVHVNNQKTLYATSGVANAGETNTWEVAHGSGVLAKQHVHAVWIAPGQDLVYDSDDDQIYIGAEEGVYQNAATPPWDWKQVMASDPIRDIAPVPGNGHGNDFYVATYHRYTERGYLYRFDTNTGVETQLLMTNDAPYKLAPYF